MRTLLLLAGTTTALVTLSASPAMALGTPQRPTGSVVTSLASDNGGDNGWGNCGHNSSGGATPTGSGAVGERNGGYKPGDVCPASEDPTTSTTGSPAGISYS